MISPRRIVHFVLHRTFDIRQGEYRLAIALSANIFLLISTLTLVKPVVTALFMARFGSSELPRAYVVVALAAVLAAGGYTWLLRRISAIRAVQRVTLSSAAVLVLMGALLYFNLARGWSIYLFYVWAAIFGVLSASQFWSLANSVYNLREAKRIFGFIGTGGIAGGIFGGYLALALVSAIGSENMVFVAATLILITVPLNSYIWRHSAGRYSEFRLRKGQVFDNQSALSLILKSPLLAYMAAIVAVSVVVAKLIDYQFTSAAYLQYKNTDDLASFLGFWLSTLNVFSLAVQVVLTRRVVGVWGVGSSLLVLPLALTVALAAAVAAPELWAFVLLRVLDGGLKQSINKSAFELLSIPLNAELKKRTKSYIDVVIDSLATGIAGLLLVLLVNALEVKPWVLSLSLALLIGGWLFLVLKVRQAYLASISVMASGVEFRTSAKSRRTRPTSVINSVAKVLESGTEPQRLYMLRRVSELRDTRFAHSIAQCAVNGSPAVQAAALRALYFYSGRWLEHEQLEPMLRHPHQNLRIAAFEYLVKLAERDRSDLLERYLNDHDPYISGTALLILTRESRSSYTLRRRAELQARIEKRLAGLGQLQEPTLKAFEQRNAAWMIAALGNTSFYPTLQALMDDEQVGGEAMAAAASTLHPRFIPALCAKLADKSARQAASAALGRYGTKLSETLTQLAKEGRLPSKSLPFLPELILANPSRNSGRWLLHLAALADAQLQEKALLALKSTSAKLSRPERLQLNALIMAKCSLLGHLQRAWQALVLAQRMAKLLPESGEALARTGLIEIIESRMELHVHRLLQALEVSNPAIQAQQLFLTITKGSETDRYRAIEFLDNAVSVGLRAEVIASIEGLAIAGLSQQARPRMVIDELQALNWLLHQSDHRLCLSAIYLVGMVTDQRYLPLLQPFLTHSSASLKAAAVAAIAKLHAPDEGK